jgi:hypothetical protein
MEVQMSRQAMAILAFAAAVAVVGAQDGWAQARGADAGERFVVSGVILYEGGGVAWLQEPSLTGNQTVALRLSDSIGPYRLTKILDDRIELQGPAGTVLVPVYNAPTGSGSAVAMTHDGAGTPQAGAPGVAASAPQAASPDVVPPTARALRERLEVARRHVQQLQASGQTVAQQGVSQPGQVSAPKATIGQPNVGGGSVGTTAAPQTGTPEAPLPLMGSGAQGGGQVAAPTPGSGTNEVVIAEKRQTFQQMLGLK